VLNLIALISVQELILFLLLVIFISRGGIFGLNYYTLSNSILLINLIGNFVLEQSLFSMSTINFVLFIVVHAEIFKFSSRKTHANRLHENMHIQPLLLKLMLLLVILAIGYFYWRVGFLILENDILTARKSLGLGRGIYSRMILHLLPILSGFSVLNFIRNKKLVFLIPPVLSLVAILMTGYRGFVFFTLVYFGMLWGLRSQRRVGINFTNLTIVIALMYVVLNVTSKMSYDGLTMSESILGLVRRIFIDNVYGYNVLVNNVNEGVMVVKFWDTRGLAHDLFISEFGTSGQIAQLGGELTYTLPGWSYASGGVSFTVFIAGFLGLIAARIQKKITSHRYNDFIVVLYTFLLFSFLMLLNKGYVANYFRIVFLSFVAISSIMFIPFLRLYSKQK